MCVYVCDILYIYINIYFGIYLYYCTSPQRCAFSAREKGRAQKQRDPVAITLLLRLLLKCYYKNNNNTPQTKRLAAVSCVGRGPKNKELI